MTREINSKSQYNIFPALSLVLRKHYPPNQLPTSGNDHCYQLNHLGQTWAEAVSTCNGNLLTILNDAEFQFVTKEILEPQAEGSVLWLAGRKLKDGWLL